MFTVRAMAWGVLVCIALPSVGRADPLMSGSWTVYSGPQAAAQILNNSGSQVADAYINFSGANLSEASVLTTGTAQPWYLSPAVSQAYGHTPSASEQASFASQVLADVNTTYALAGLSPNITIDPTVPANHEISVVSGLSYSGNAKAIGITDVGHDGFGFIDKLQYANSPGELAWAVAHNVAHELMHAFGVAVHADQTGQYIDTASATWGLLTNPNATFSPAATNLIAATNFSPSALPTTVPGQTGLQIDGGQEVMAVPEPTTVAAWSIVVLGALFRGRRTGVCLAA